MPTRDELLSMGWVSVIEFREYEYLAWPVDKNNILIHVVKNGKTISEYPESYTFDKIDALAIAKAKLDRTRADKISESYPYDLVQFRLTSKEVADLAIPSDLMPAFWKICDKVYAAGQNDMLDKIYGHIKYIKEQGGRL